MMDLLLDTHVAIWWMEGSDRLGAQCKAALFQPGARLWISTASVWEMAIKSGLGRLRSGMHSPRGVHPRPPRARGSLSPHLAEPCSRRAHPASAPRRSLRPHAHRPGALRQPHAGDGGYADPRLRYPNARRRIVDNRIQRT